METNSVLLMVLFLVLVAVDCSSDDPKVDAGVSVVLDQNANDTVRSTNKKDDSSLVSSSVEGIKVSENKGDQAHGSKDNVNDNKSESNGNVQSSSKGGDSVQKGKGESGVQMKEKPEVEKNEKSGHVMDRVDVDKEGGNAGDASLRKDGFRGEECDPSNRCTDEGKKFVACLQVPGNESPDIFLLIQNKEKGPRSITISAPAYVQLEKKKVQLQEKENRKVKVSIRNGGADSLILIKEGKSGCSLDFRDLIVYNSANSYVNFLSETSTPAIVFLAAVLITASSWMCISFRRRQLARSGSKYQRLDMELPVSGGTKTETDVNDGWDNNWDDGWDDEEAPKTPSMPVTPSLSSKGLASRRLSKEGWKD